MKILLVTPFLPYPEVRHAGGKLCLHLLRTLAERHEVHLVARAGPGEHGHVDAIRALVRGLDVVAAPGARARGSLLGIVGVVRSYRRLCERARAVAERGDFDLAQVEFTETGVFWRPLRDLPAVITCHDVLAKPAARRLAQARGLARVLAWLKVRAICALERRALGKFAAVCVLSEVDRRWAMSSYPGIVPRVLTYPAGLGFAGLARAPVPGRVLFVGALNRVENQLAVDWFVRGCWPVIRAAVPAASFHIVGHGAPDAWRDGWAGQAGVTVVGEVASVEEHYARASVFVAPMLVGGGVVVKVLDALAASVATVTTTYGNEGIDAPDGVALMVADAVDAFAAAVIGLLVQAGPRDSLAAAGRQFVVAARGAAKFAVTLDSIHADLVASRRT